MLYLNLINQAKQAVINQDIDKSKSILSIARQQGIKIRVIYISHAYPDPICITLVSFLK